MASVLLISATVGSLYGIYKYYNNSLDETDFEIIEFLEKNKDTKSEIKQIKEHNNSENALHFKNELSTAILKHKDGILLKQTKVNKKYSSVGNLEGVYKNMSNSIQYRK